jgi:predicted glycoside hydrolase/deacetylase ChbG (UPF0249 family)
MRKGVIMRRKKIILLILLIVFSISCEKGQEQEKTLLIRCDDIGMCHAVNMATKKLIETELPFSASVMFCCPWYQEAAQILKDHPEVSVGVHLVLNAEWENYRWGPVLGPEAVPSLVDSCGYFFPSRKLFSENNPKIEDVEKELRAQIERALGTELQIDYVDYHMGTAVSTPELRLLVEKLAQEYGLGISRYFGEVDIHGVYFASPEHKLDSLLARIEKLPSDQLNLMVFHIGLENPEMNALLDLNPSGLPNMSQHRHAELEALCSKKFRNSLKRKHIQLITYRNLISEMGLDKMSRPR